MPETKAFVQSPFPMLISGFDFCCRYPKKRTIRKNKPQNSKLFEYLGTISSIDRGKRFEKYFESGD